MIIEAICIAGYWLICDHLNPNKNRKKEISTKSMEGDIMKDVEKKLKGINITAGGSVNININIQINNYENSTFTELTFNKSPLNFDFSHSELFTRKQENYLAESIKFSLESIKPKRIPELQYSYDDPFKKAEKLFGEDWFQKILNEPDEKEEPDSLKRLKKKYGIF